MGTSNATVTATNSRSNVNQTITFRTSGGASSITLNGTSRTNGQTMSLACGTYNLSGSFNSGYEFSSWSNSGGSIANRNTLSTRYTVNGPGTITLTGKSSIVGYMQDFTKSQCQSLASSASVLVQDRRDNNTYTVRYINGACWMTQNLRLAGGTTLTTSDSHVTRNYTLPTTQLAGNSGSYTAPQTTISSNTSYGGYYNYCAASAGTVCSSSSAQSATQDICPKGWRLPNYTERNGIRSYSSAFSPVYSGYYYNGSLYSTGSRGLWWSATASDSTYQYVLYYSSDSLLAGSDYKSRGLSVRCIRSS